MFLADFFDEGAILRSCHVRRAIIWCIDALQSLQCESVAYSFVNILFFSNFWYVLFWKGSLVPYCSNCKYTIGFPDCTPSYCFMTTPAFHLSSNPKGCVEIRTQTIFTAYAANNCLSKTNLWEARF